MTSLPLPFAAKVAAFAVFAALLAGAVYGVDAVIGGEVALQSFGARTPHETLNGTAGHTVTFAVTLLNRGDTLVAAVARLSGDIGSGQSPLTTTPGNANATVFVPVVVDADAAPGVYPFRLDVVDAEGNLLRQTAEFARLRVLPAAPAFADGDTATVIYTGRIASTGAVFNTNDPALAGLNFPKTDFFGASTGVLPVQTVPRPSVVEGFYEGILGMQPGESRTITFPPEKGYGSATIEEPSDRRDTLERLFELDLVTETVGRDVFDQYITDSQQGNPATYGAGDIFLFTQGTNKWPYRIETIDGNEVSYRLAVQVGETYTLYNYWTNGTVVQSVDGTHAVFFTTPTTAAGEKFTMRQHWPQMSAVESVTDEEIVVRHDPPVGLKYVLSQSPGSAPREYAVTSVGDDTIVSTTTSTNPLAGKTLTFDVRLVELVKG